MKRLVMQALDTVGLSDRARQAKRAALRVPHRLGLGEPMRRFGKFASERGWTRDWKPLVPEEAFLECCVEAIGTLRRHAPDSEIGDYLEFGVSRGTSLACMHQALDRTALRHVRLFGFDSFEGLPPEAAREGWNPGDFKSTLGATRRNLTRAGVEWDRVRLVKGWFRETLTDASRDQLGLRRASLIMVDCDIYAAARECLHFCAPLIGDHAVLFFDDWDMDSNGAGEKKAFAEFLAEHPEFHAEPLRSYLPTARVFLVTRDTATAAAAGRDGARERVAATVES